MAKNKPKKTASRQQDIFKTASGEELAALGERLMQGGKYRDAVESLKMAAKKGAPNDRVTPLLRRAYTMRAQQLLEKGLMAEAAAVRQIAFALMPPAHRMSEGDLLDSLKMAGLEQAIAAYADFLKAGKPSPAIETLLAERLIAHSQWDILETLPETCVIRKDAAIAAIARDFMNQGEWASALDALKSIPRTSPWASVRLLCLALTCFQNEDDPGMHRALSMIPEGSALAPLARVMAADTRAIPCLWEGPLTLEHDIQRLLGALTEQNLTLIQHLVKKIASVLHPQNPTLAVCDLLALLGPVFIRQNMDPDDYFNIMDALLPYELSSLISLKLESLMGNPRPLRRMLRYIPLLQHEFPDKKDQDIAAALLIQDAVNKNPLLISGAHASQQVVSFKDIKELKKHFQLGATSIPGVITELLNKASVMDPENRGLYELLAAHIDTAVRESKKWVEEGLLRMKTHFPDDPYPCLQLAKLYYTQNAHRKAETNLNEAFRRAPHDSGVLTMRVVSLLVSAHQNIKRGNMPLALQDIDKAEAFGDTDLRFLVAEKRILASLAVQDAPSRLKKWMGFDNSRLNQVMEDGLIDLSLTDRIKTLAALTVDIDLVEKHSALREQKVLAAKNALGQLLKKSKALTAADAAALLSPPRLPMTISSAVNNIAKILVEQDKTILSRVEDGVLPGILENLLHLGLMKPALAELKRRIPKTPAPLTHLLKFYEITFRHLNRTLKNNANEYKRLLAKVPAPEMEAIRLASRRLAQFADPGTPLHDALSTFDFNRLFQFPFHKIFRNFGPEDLPFPKPSDLDWDDDDDDDDDEEEDEYSNYPKMLLMELEEILEREHMAGAPKGILKFFRKQLLRERESAEMIEILNKSLDPDTVATLSREARILIFGK